MLAFLFFVFLDLIPFQHFNATTIVRNAFFKILFSSYFNSTQIISTHLSLQTSKVFTKAQKCCYSLTRNWKSHQYLRKKIAYQSTVTWRLFGFTCFVAALHVLSRKSLVGIGASTSPIHVLGGETDWLNRQQIHTTQSWIEFSSL